MSRETRNVRQVTIQLHQKQYNCSTYVGVIRTRPQIATHKWAGPTKKCTGRWSWYTVHCTHLITLITCKNQWSGGQAHPCPSTQCCQTAAESPSHTTNYTCTKWMETSRKRDGISHIFWQPTWLLCLTKLPLLVDSSHHTVNPQPPIASDGRAPTENHHHSKQRLGQDWKTSLTSEEVPKQRTRPCSRDAAHHICSGYSSLSWDVCSISTTEAISRRVRVPAASTC